MNGQELFSHNTGRPRTAQAWPHQPDGETEAPLVLTAADTPVTAIRPSPRPIPTPTRLNAEQKTKNAWERLYQDRWREVPWPWRGDVPWRREDSGEHTLDPRRAMIRAHPSTNQRLALLPLHRPHAPTAAPRSRRISPTAPSPASHSLSLRLAQGTTR
jgi:hypothetical protein